MRAKGGGGTVCQKKKSGRLLPAVRFLCVCVCLCVCVRALSRRLLRNLLRNLLLLLLLVYFLRRCIS